MAVFESPTFTADYQGLCNAVADWLNRQDLLTSIPNFVAMATSRIRRDMARVKHPDAIIRAQASAIDGYITLPLDFVAVHQLMRQDTQEFLDYLSPDQSKTVQSEGWGTPVPDNFATGTGTRIYYTLIGGQIRLLPPPGTTSPTDLDLWYYARLADINATTTTNWVLAKYPDLYLYGTLIHSAPFLKNDERVATWGDAYRGILADIELEADRAVRSQTKLVAARKSF